MVKITSKGKALSYPNPLKIVFLPLTITMMAITTKMTKIAMMTVEMFL